MSGIITGEQIEFANRSRLIVRLFELGYEVFVPVIDAGVDLLAYRGSDRNLRPIQLKTRWTIDKKYLGRDIWIAFPSERLGDWFLAPHDELVRLGEGRGYCRTSSWVDKRLYHLTPLPQALALAMDQWRLSTRS
jgi:hypothetical protein